MITLTKHGIARFLADDNSVGLVLFARDHFDVTLTLERRISKQIFSFCAFNGMTNIVERYLYVGLCVFDL